MPTSTIAVENKKLGVNKTKKKLQKRKKYRLNKQNKSNGGRRQNIDRYMAINKRLDGRETENRSALLSIL